MSGGAARDGEGGCRVSVVIPTFNRAHFLPTNADSVLAQDFDDYEVIYVDDGSTDDTPAVLDAYQKTYGERVRVVRTEQLGPGRARNAGVGVARGEFLLFTDDDVVAPPNWVGGMLERHAAAGSDLLCGGIGPFSMATPVERYLHYRMQIALGEKARPLSVAPTGNLLIPKAWFDRVGGFRDEPLAALEDWDLCHRLGAQGATIYYDPAVEVKHCYQSEWGPAAERMRATGALGLYVAKERYRSVTAYVGYSFLRFVLSPLWIPRRYPLSLYVLALRMEGVFCLARLKAYGASLVGRGPSV